MSEEKVIEGKENEQLRTTLKKQEFINEIANSVGVISVICTKVGISEKTFYEWKKNDPEFYRAIREVQATMNDKIEDILIGKALIQKDGPSIRFYLANKHPSYKQKLKVDASIIPVKPLEDILREAALRKKNGESASRPEPVDAGQQGVDRGATEDQNKEGGVSTL